MAGLDSPLHRIWQHTVEHAACGRGKRAGDTLRVVGECACMTSIPSRKRPLNEIELLSDVSASGEVVAINLRHVNVFPFGVWTWQRALWMSRLSHAIVEVILFRLGDRSQCTHWRRETHRCVEFKCRK